MRLTALPVCLSISPLPPRSPSPSSLPLLHTTRDRQQARPVFTRSITRDSTSPLPPSRRQSLSRASTRSTRAHAHLLPISTHRQPATPPRPYSMSGRPSSTPAIAGPSRPRPVPITPQGVAGRPSGPSTQARTSEPSSAGPLQPVSYPSVPSQSPDVASRAPVRESASQSMRSRWAHARGLSPELAESDLAHVLISSLPSSPRYRDPLVRPDRPRPAQLRSRPPPVSVYPLPRSRRPLSRL